GECRFCFAARRDSISAGHFGYDRSDRMTAQASEDRQFDALLDYLKRNRGFDFAAYKRPSLMRRMKKRVHGVGVETLSDYLDYLEVRPEEFGQLFNTILINVTS